MWSFVKTFGSHSPHVKKKLIIVAGYIVVVLTNTKGDVERHRVCDKHIIKVAEPSSAVTVVNLSTRGLMSIVVVVPSNQPPINGRMTLR